MHCKYRSFDLDVTRVDKEFVEVSAYHWDLGELICNIYNDKDSVLSHMKYLKGEIDDMIENPEIPSFNLSEEEIFFIKQNKAKMML